MDIEETVQQINTLIDNPDKNFKPHEVMQLSQSVLNLAHAAAVLADTERNKDSAK